LSFDKIGDFIIRLLSAKESQLITKAAVNSSHAAILKESTDHGVMNWPCDELTGSRLVSEMTYCVSSGTLNPTHSFTHW